MPEPQIIKANKNPIGGALVGDFYFRRSLRRNFHSIWLLIDPQTKALLRQFEQPVIYASAHPSWWDGHLAWLLDRTLSKRDTYLMMDVISLRNFRFFTWAGAFSVDRTDVRSALASISYIAAVLRSGPRKSLWIFPQGTITPAEKRPIRFYPGVSHVVRQLEGCQVVPVAWRIAYRLEQHAEIYCIVGQPQTYAPGDHPGSRTITARLEESITTLDDKLADLLANTDPEDSLPGFKRLMRGRGSPSRNFNRFLDIVRAPINKLTGKK